MAVGQAHDLHRDDKRVQHAILGCQEWLYWADASAAQGANPAGLNAGAPQGNAIAGFRLKDLAALIAGTVQGAGTVTALAAGTYYVLFQMNGMSTVYLDLNMTFSGGAGVTVNAYSTQKDEQTSRQTFTNSPLTLTTNTTNRTLQLTTPQGEQYGVMSVVVGAGTTVTAITLAEVCGQRG